MHFLQNSESKATSLITKFRHIMPGVCHCIAFGQSNPFKCYVSPKITKWGENCSLSGLGTTIPYYWANNKVEYFTISRKWL